ncbi:glycine-rich domain containing protein [Nitzschia inconspicua]|uniref:Glycine-rich domain containing protein n=1 Tax=Nitzschia inconspicua TaxID=303405 RepID=A0A9K3KHW0_9STRA|nr:glycine-rich domain containing protein [Nitzschia inconspicua]
MDHQFSSDLVVLAKHHIEFLRALHEHGITLSRPSLESLRRYRDLWLPLVHANTNQDRHLIPPADIAWLWHCHRLAPFKYVSYCKARFNDSVMEANPPFAAHFAMNNEVFCLDKEDGEIQDMVSWTLHVWNERYPEESFHCTETLSTHDHPLMVEVDVKQRLLDELDLLSSTERQSSFLWQVSAPNFFDTNFLEEGLVNYHKFLFLKKMSPRDMIIVPTFQIDLFWHTHILSSMAGYYKDCMAIIGSPLHHDDGFDDRTEGGPLDTAYNATKDAWMTLYGEDYHVEGGMYRGEPPSLYYSPEFVFESKRMNAHYMQSSPNHPFHRFVGVQGASSTTPSAESINAKSMDVIWCWRETPAQMNKHSGPEIFGHPKDCWICYSSHDNASLEAAYQQYGTNHQVIIGNGKYKVDFSTMKQSNVKTGFEREVKRFVKKNTMNEKTSFVEMSSAANVSMMPATQPSKPSPTFGAAAATPIVATPYSQWTNPRGFTPDGEPAFIRHNAKSRQRGVNANPMKIDYIFGNDCCGVGYYHVTTKEAYNILDKRITVRARKIENDIAFAMCCDCSGGKNKTPYVVKKEKELQELLENQLIIKARAKAEYPVGEVNDPGTVNVMTKRGYRYNDYYADNGIWLFPAAFYDSGGGCGAVGILGGGCGGGACGAGCGGGGCGGGGCGGGCGGGGCGG